jgi:hypothetical protein
MTTVEIVAGIDRSLAEIAAERERLLGARAQLVGSPARAEGRASKRSRGSKRRRVDTMTRVLEALDPSEPRTAGEVENLSGVGRAVAGTTLSRLEKEGKTSKAKRRNLRVSA